MYSQVIIIVTIYYKQFIIIYDVSEHQLPLIIDASHTMPITHVNQGPELLKLISGRHCPYFKRVTYFPRPWPMFVVLNQAVPLGT